MNQSFKRLKTILTLLVLVMLSNKANSQTNNYFPWCIEEHSFQTDASFSRAMNFKTEPPVIEKTQLVNDNYTGICDTAGNLMC